MSYRDDYRDDRRDDRRDRDRDRDREDGGRLYVGNLPRDIRTSEIESLFRKYGRIRDIAVKGPYAFVTFEHSRDADDAIYGRDNYDFDGHRLRVERSHGNKRRDAPRGSYSGQHSKYRVKVSGLPTSCSWQDLKDFCRDAGSVLFTDVSRDGTGVVEFEKEDDMLWALKNLDGIKLKTHTGDESYVRFVEESGARSRSPSPRRERSRSPPPRDSPPRGTPPPPQE